MRKRILAVAIPLVWIVLAVLVVKTVWHGSDAAPSVLDTHSLPVHADLRTSDKTESIRLVTYGADGLTPVKADVSYDNGDTAVIEFMPDGKTYKNEKRIREDGSLVKVGQRQKNGDYATTEYYEDGKSISETKLVNDIGYLIKLESFYADGSVHILNEVNSNGTSKKVVYSATGKLELSDATDGSGVRRVVHYREDGVTAKMKFVAESYDVVAYYYRPDGTLYEERTFDTSANMDVKVYDREGHALYEQSWVPDYTTYKSGSYKQDYLLSTLTIFGGNDGKDRKITYGDDGKTIVSGGGASVPAEYTQPRPFATPTVPLPTSSPYDHYPYY